mgnify:CR=1 FL=1
MTPLALFLLACAAVLVGTVSAAFSAMMRLSLRLSAERSDRDDLLGGYLDDPMRLFIPTRLVLAIIYVVAGALLARVIGMEAGHGLPTLIAAMAVFAMVSEHLVPLVIIRHDPEAVLSAILPAFHPVERLLRPVTLALLRIGKVSPSAGANGDTTGASANGAETMAESPQESGGGLESGPEQARALLRSIVDFRDTLVREVMTPRPDIIAIEVTQTIEDLRRLFRDQQYSRVPVFDGTLDNILGFAFVKDMVRHADGAGVAIRDVLRPAHYVPETKKVPALLHEFQRERVQSAITQEVGTVIYSGVSIVGSKVSGELFASGLLALGAAIVLMFAYIWFRFEPQFGFGAVAGLVHDVILVFGLIVLMRLEFNLNMVAAILTVIGYSMNDTVVVFDRLRENLRKYKTMPLRDVIDLSINETLSRTIITGVTAIMVLAALAVFGGVALFGFSIALMAGIIIGTYSSVYVAAPIILLWGVKRGEFAEDAKPIKLGMASRP